MLLAASTCRPAPAATGWALRPHRPLQAPARASSRSRLGVVRASVESEKEAAAQAGQERSVDAVGSADFAALAKQLTGSLASEFADPQTLDKLSRWLAGSQDEGDREGTAEALPPRTDQATAESTSTKLLRKAAEYYGVPTTLSGAVDSAKQWLSGPPAGGQGSAPVDTQMVAHLLHRLLSAYEREQGEPFEGLSKRQYDRLYTLARSVLGSSLSKRVLTRLVRAYLGI